MERATHSKLVGYLFWIFGFVGAHRFYYGRQLSGLLWLCTAGLFLVGWLVDLFLIPGMNRSAAQRYRSGPCDYSVAWILLALLGVLGLHRFYLGKVGTGILWLCTGGLLGIGLVVDLFTLNGQVDERNGLTAI